MAHPIKHILMPTDFSGYSNNAFHFALNLAQKNGASLTLLHVVEPPYNFATAVEGILQIMEKNAYSRLNKMIDETENSEFDEVEVETKVVHGRTSREIISQIKECNADVIVMGSQGQTGLKRVVFGSVSAVVMEDSPIPVFVIPAEGQSVGQQISDILFITNLRENDPENLVYLQSITSLFKANIKVIYFTGNHDFESQIRFNGFSKVIDGLGLDPSPEMTVRENKSALCGLSEYLEENPASIVVLNRYKRSIVQSLFGKDDSDEMMNYSKTPILILP